MGAATLVGVCAGLVTAALALAGFWLALGSRIQRGESNSETAVQIGAENAEAIKDLAKEIDHLREHAGDALDQARRSFVETVDHVRREFGQTVEAIRSKVHGFETWSRDEFMRKQSFNDAVSRIETGQAKRDEQLEKRLDRLEGKLDRAMQSKHPSGD